MSDAGRHVLACAPVIPIPGLPPCPNTHFDQTACEKCGQLVYIGPNLTAMRAATGLPVQCMVCAIDTTSAEVKP